MFNMFKTQMDTLHLKRSLLTLTQSKESPKCCKVILDLQIDPHVFFLQDFLDINALCAGSIAAITTGAAAIAPYGAAVHAACRYGHFLKTPKAQQQVAKFWNSPGYDPVAGIPPRRLEELEEETAQKPLKESLDQIAANRESLEQLKKVIDVPKPGNTEADMETLLNLMGEEKPRAAWPYQC